MYIPLESKNVKSFVHDLHLLHIVNGVNLDLAKAAGRIICEQLSKLSQFRALIFTIDVIRQLARLVEVDNVGDQEVEDVVTSLTPVQFIRTRFFKLLAAR